ncbi:MAG: Translation initiation factor 1, partial [uncultured Ramlibacter sp.]
GQGRIDRNARTRGRGPAGLALSGRARERARPGCVQRRQDAQEPHPHHRGRLRHARTVPLRPDQGPHHVPPPPAPGRWRASAPAAAL